MYKWLHGTGPAYLADELSHSSDFANRRKLRSASSLNLIVRRTRLSTYGDRAFPVAGPRVWNSLPPHVTSASSTFLNPVLRLFSSLAPIRNLIVSPCVKCLWHFGHYNRLLYYYYYYYYYYYIVDHVILECEPGVTSHACTCEINRVNYIENAVMDESTITPEYTCAVYWLSHSAVL